MLEPTSVGHWPERLPQRWETRHQTQATGCGHYNYSKMFGLWRGLISLHLPQKTLYLGQIYFAKSALLTAFFVET